MIRTLILFIKETGQYSYKILSPPVTQTLALMKYEHFHIPLASWVVCYIYRENVGTLRVVKLYNVRMRCLEVEGYSHVGFKIILKREQLSYSIMLVLSNHDTGNKWWRKQQLIPNLDMLVSHERERGYLVSNSAANFSNLGFK